jgi:diguanylate cyclase (GGDEF)-like protein
MSNSQPQNFRGNILVVDDAPDNLRVLSAALTERGYQVRCAKNGAMALLTTQKDPPHLILLDIKMPDMDGYQVCERLKADKATFDIPIIFLSAFDDVLDKVKAFTVGGADYITKPFHIEEVVVRVQHQLALQAAKFEVSQLNAELERKVQHRTAQLEVVINKLNQEIEGHQQAQRQLMAQALHDALTELPNRTLFMEHLQNSLQRCHRIKDDLFAVLFIDLDRFKVINDSWGHAVGDQLLIRVAKILKKCTRQTDIVARLSGDEFVILLNDLEDFQDAIKVAERLLGELTAPIHLARHTVFSGASIGIVFGSSNYQNGMDLLRDADIAMYRAKALGKGRYAIFDQDMYAQAIHLSQIETDLRYALERQEFLLYYQPITCLKTRQILGFEALLRWQHPIRGLVTPDQFITIAEDSGLIIRIGEWVLQEACQQLCNWHLQLPDAASISISVNLSSKQIKQYDFLSTLDGILTDTGLQGEYLRLELTESMLMDHSDKTMKLLSSIKERRVQLSIDDFGTGYSSLSYLHHFPIDMLKIDRSFVNQIKLEENNDEIVKTIITLAHSLGIQAIAEGVETEHQVTHLRNLNCDAAQGYFFSQPVPAYEAEAIIAGSLQSVLQPMYSCLD